MGLEIIDSEEPLTWKKFEKYIQEDIQSAKSGDSHWIYRGLSNAEWSLETSLERFLKDELSQNLETYPAKTYYFYLASIVPAVNSLTAQRFPRFSPEKVSIPRGLGTMPHYKLLCFARHHGFPTPLLDWTASYYVAAFFAFRHAKPNQNVAIFAYQEWIGESRGLSLIDLADPTIYQQGP